MLKGSQRDTGDFSGNFHLTNLGHLTLRSDFTRSANIRQSESQTVFSTELPLLSRLQFPHHARHNLGLVRFHLRKCINDPIHVFFCMGGGERDAKQA